MPLLSIIIPSFNSLNVLQKCIDSINDQSFKDYEVIVVDAESKDDTLDYLITLKPPFFWITESDQGIYDAMNKGIRLAKGQWLYFLGCDDRIYNRSTLENIFSHDIIDDILMIIGKVKYDFVQNDSYLIKKNKGLFNPSWSKKLWIKNTLHHQGIFYKNEIFTECSYALEYKILADYNLNLSLFRSKSKVKLIDEIVAECKTQGLSKKYNWNLYQEEIELKTKQSSIFIKPFFFVLSFIKYVLKKAI